jgi:branched-chain amino acid transport system substrate-binding protein
MSRIMSRRNSWAALRRIMFMSAWRVALLLALMLLNRPLEAAEYLTIAVAASLTGSSSHVGPEMVNSIQMLVDRVNETGGVAGRLVRLAVYDDASSVETAEQVAEQIGASDALLVLGHLLSVVSLDAGPVYRAAGIPAITGSAASDAITVTNPYYFRMIPALGTQGTMIAAYLRDALQVNRTTIIYSDDTFGRTLTNSFAAEFGKDGAVVQLFPYSSRAPDAVQQRWDIVARLLAVPNPGSIFLAMVDTDVRDFLVDLKRSGVQVPIMGSQSLGRDVFLSLFADLPEERRSPGYFAEGVYATSPTILDTANKDVLSFAEAYARRFGSEPGWTAVKYYEAAQAAISALKNVEIGNTPDSRRQDRNRIRAYLEGRQNAPSAIPGLTGPIYFDDDRNRVESFRLGRFQSGRFVSAPIQFSRIYDLSLLDVKSRMTSGQIIQIAGNYYWKQHVVYTGIDVNTVDRIDLRDSTFSIDFYLWMRHAPQDDIASVDFPDLIRGNFDPGNPVTQGDTDGLTYRLYRIKGEFKNSFELRDYPFDAQSLTIRFANSGLTRDQVVYAVDSIGLKPAVNSRDIMHRDPQVFEQWRLRAVSHLRDDLVLTSTLGDPRAFNSARILELPGFKTTIEVQRHSAIFLIKNLFPLGLLSMVLYSTLFFPESLLKERVTVPVASMLSAALFLTASNSKLPEINYTTALEFIFYVFFLQCLFCIIVALVEERLRLVGLKSLSRAVDATSHIVFPVIVAATIIKFVLAYADRF